MPLSSYKTLKTLRKEKPIWSNLWFKGKPSKNVRFNLEEDIFRISPSSIEQTFSNQTPTVESSFDCTSLLSDELLLHILSFLPDNLLVPNSLVCKRWFFLLGRLVQSIKLLDWTFLESGRMFYRFPNIADVDLIPCSQNTPQNFKILLNYASISVDLNSDLSEEQITEQRLQILSHHYPNLRKLVVIGPMEDVVLNIVVTKCLMLQELELHRCSESMLDTISTCKNLQILKLIGCIEGFYDTKISDIGLTILANGCPRLVKLELTGCRGSYKGISSIGRCCKMLEELTLCNHKMEGGWIAGLSLCDNLKTLKFKDCKNIDTDPELIEFVSSCPTIEHLHMQQCQLRDKNSVRALFLVCRTVRNLGIHDCWGLDNEIFSIADLFRRVKFLSLEGCSLLTTRGLESVILSWNELESLRVVSCNNIKDDEISPNLSNMFSILKELTWRPDSQSVLQSSLAGTLMGKKGSKFFKKI